MGDSMNVFSEWDFESILLCDTYIGICFWLGKNFNYNYKDIKIFLY